MAATAERSVVDVLRAARERISDPERWTTGYYGRTAEGGGTVANDPEVCAWCVRGAVLVEYDLPSLEDPAARATDFLSAAAGSRSVIRVNDQEGHAAALGLLDRAIKLAEAAQS